MVKSISEEEQILAAGYVLGDLSTTEITEFEAALATNPALQAEVSALQVAFNQIPQGLTPVPPPPTLKAKIVDSVVVAENPNPAVSVSAPISVPTAVTSKGFPWSRVLAGIGLLIGGLFAFDNFRLRQELQFARQVNRQDFASVLSQPKSRLLALSTQEDKVVGNVLFTPGNWQQVIISAQNLPPLPVDRVYRMWLELANGQVIPCGEFKTDDLGSVFIKLNAKQNPPAGVKAKGVFITIDRANDPLEPTGQRVIQGTI